MMLVGFAGLGFVGYSRALHGLIRQSVAVFTLMLAGGAKSAREA